MSELIRWCGIVNRNGVIISQKTRHGLKLLLTDEENEEYAASAIARQRTRSKYESKIGKLEYAAGRYEKVIRATIPIDDSYFLLVTFDPGTKEYDTTLVDGLLPFVKRNKPKFIAMNDSI